MRQKRQMDKLRFLTESRNGKESVIEKLIHKDNSSSNRISCSIAEKSDIKSVMDICFARQQWMTEQGFDYVLNKDNRKYYRHQIEDRKLWVCKQSGVVMGFCVVEDHDINGYWKDFPTDSFVYAHDGMTRPHKSVKETSDYNFIGILINAIIDFYGKGIRFDVLLPNQRLESFYEKELGCNPVKKVIDEDDGSCHLLMEKTNNNPSLTESFTKKISSKKNTDLISEPSFVLEDGVYILHETLGVKGVEGWNPKNNDGVVGVLVVEDDHKIVVALEDSPENLHWSKKRGLINQPIETREDAKSDFNGEYYCQKLNSPDFPAAYYCKTYNKGNRSWYLPSSGELWLIYNHLEEIQNALETVGGQKFVTTWDDENDVPEYWSSTESTATCARKLDFDYGLSSGIKVESDNKVRPISKFKPSILKESFTRKIRSKKNDELTTKADTAFVPDGVYILHETLGVKGVEDWNPKDNKGVVGILLVEDDHKIVVATEDAPKKLRWSKFRALKQINEPIKKKEDAESDFNGEEHCIKLNSPDFPAAYYCLNYKKGGRNWYLPSTGELWLIYNHLEEIQNALETVGGKKFVTSWDDNLPWYWSSTEESDVYAWLLNLSNGNLYGWNGKAGNSIEVRPVSKFDFSTLKESFTRKIRSKKNDELISKPAFEIPDGVYILHETLGVCGVDNWDSENNDGVEGILVKDNDTKLIVSVDEFTEIWARKLQSKFNVNKMFIYSDSLNASDKKKYTGKILCQKLNSPDFPAAYRCLCYHKGNINNWYLPSIQELHTIAEHRHEIQEALIKVNGDILKFSGENVIILKSRSGQGGNWYWSSTESHREKAWSYNFDRDIDNGWTRKSENSFQVRPVAYFGEDSGLEESFTRKISQKKNDELISKADTAFVPDGVYILHETLGVKTVDGWNPKDNDGVVGILLIEDEHQIVIALEDSPDNLHWSKKCGLINQSIEKLEDAESDFNGEVYCQKLNSPDFPAAYYCKTYNKGNRSWNLPSFGELWLIYNHLEEIQNTLSIVGGQKFVTTWDEDVRDIKEVPLYWSSTELSDTYAWLLYLGDDDLEYWPDKVSDIGKVRPVSKFDFSTLKESFTKKIKKSSNKDLVDIADKLASTTYDYNEENFTRKLRKETEQYFESEFYKVYHYPLDYRYNGDIWPADEDGFHNMYLESTYWAERNEEVDFEGYFNDDTNNCAEPADVGVIVFGYGKDCVAYNEYGEYRKTHPLTESFTTKTKNKTVKDLQNKSDNIFNIDNLLREYVKSHCRPGSHNYDFYFSEENRPVFSDKEWKKLKGITVVKEIDDYYPSLHVVTPHGSTISNDFLPNVDDVFLFYVYKRRKFHIPVNRLPEKLLQELMEWILNINESFTRKTKQKSTEDIKQKADEYIGFKNLVKEIVLENDSFKENDKMSRIFRNRQPRCTHALNKLRVRPTSDPTLSPYAIQGMVVLDESFYFKPEKYNISSLLAKDLTRKAMKDLYNSDFIIVLNRIYTMEYRGKEFLRTEFHILRYNERYGRYSDEMNPQYVYFEFADLPKELQSDIYSFLRKRFNKK